MESEVEEAISIRPEIMVSRKGYIKVRLDYLTTKPRHIRSVMLSDAFMAEGPYTESCRVLVPQNKTYPLIEVFLPAFELLKKFNYVYDTDELVGFKILEDDLYGQAYFIEKL
jgi:hypothetical protein